MARLLLRDEQWKAIKGVFPAEAATGRPRRDRRVIVDAIFWVLRTGAPWRDLPEEFGPWQTVWRLFDRWNSDGTLDKILRRLRNSFAKSGDFDGQLWCVDGTIIRAARCAAGGGKKGIRRNQPIMR